MKWGQIWEINVLFKMNKKQHIKTVDQLIHDDFFILWCLFPTEESEQVWIDDYLTLYPEEKENIEKARQMVRSLKLNNRKLSPIEKESLKENIINDLRKFRKPKRMRLTWQYAAACILIICTLGSLFLITKENLFQERDILSLVDDVQLDVNQTEVELYLAQEKMKVSDNATILVDQQGKIKVTDKDFNNLEATERKCIGEAKEKGNHMNVLSVPKGRHSSLILPDGTKVWVNSGTVLQFPEIFEKEKRMIYVEGEVYLEVTKDASCPFYVKTNQMEIRVLGTSFGIVAYKDENFQSVVLKEGSVAVEGYKSGKQIIKPNDLLVLENGQMSVSQVNVYDYISWIDGILQFREKNLGEVLRSISRYYRVQFSYPPDIEQVKCSGKLVLFDNMDQVLQTLQKTLSVSFHRKGNLIEVNSINNKK
ncbi:MULTISPECIES: FecR family protein [Parabacteroides]|uniref:FecR protein domain-containing protein n=5 Tax=Parabacteroides goldsteinii TaxID=328812 RepID=S0GEC8_9BACT|nr:MULTISPECIES: FecR domain-containing protein [Parabacteroides]EOS12089.1 hypothetical protein C803_05749 [Parabacteroides goldsteinii dnLKV18]KAI4360040.1 hypothetical protein C825_002091 [Parabacteroides sp. ASF519]MDZ3928656.1 FecR domain-containing protein [Parabacteroides goldsteinii]